MKYKIVKLGDIVSENIYIYIYIYSEKYMDKVEYFGWLWLIKFFWSKQGRVRKQ